MDLPKAKIVIIVMLIILNVILLFNNITYYREHSVQMETIDNTVSILNERGIVLECDIPRTNKAAYRLEYGSGKLDRAAIVSSLFDDTLRNYKLEKGAELKLPSTTEAQIALMFSSESEVASGDTASFEVGGRKLVFYSGTRFVFINENPGQNVDIKNDDDASKYALKYLKSKGLITGKYVLDELRRSRDGSAVVTFIQEYEGFLIYDNFCTVTVTDSGITRLEYGKLQITGFLPGRISDPASAYQVLLANYKVGEGCVITSIELGYRYPGGSSMYGAESSELLPVWRVKFKDSAEPDYLSTIVAD